MVSAVCPGYVLILSKVLVLKKTAIQQWSSHRGKWKLLIAEEAQNNEQLLSICENFFLQSAVCQGTNCICII